MLVLWLVIACQILLQQKNAKIPLRYFVTTGIYNDSYTNEPHFYDIEHETVNSLEEIDLP